MKQQFRICGTYLPWTNYFGLHFDSGEQVPKRCTEEATDRLGQLFPIIASSVMTLNQAKAYPMYYLCTHTYATFVWYYLTVMYKQKLQSVLDGLALKYPADSLDESLKYQFTGRNHWASCTQVLRTKGQKPSEFFH